jgi:hypothetical protein
MRSIPSPLKNSFTVCELPISIPQKSGQGRIRTFEGMSRQIYSLMRLTASLPAQQLCSLQRLRFSKRIHLFTSFHELAIGFGPMTC